MKNKRLFINMAANIIAFAVNFGINLFLTPYIISSVGTEAYGFIPLANNFISYINIFTIALNSMASRYISIELTNKNSKKANEYFNSVLIANTGIAFFITAPAIFMILFINNIINIPDYLLNDVQATFVFIFINFVISLIGNVFSIATFAKNRLDISARRSIEGYLIRAFVLSILFVFFEPKIYFITITTLIVASYTVITNIYFTKKLTPELKIQPRNFNFFAIKQLLSTGIWNSINQLSTVLLTSLDLLLANIFISALASGQYAIVKTIPSFIQSFVAVLVSIFVPEFTILYAKNKMKELINSIKFSIKIMGITITLPIAFLLVNGAAFYSLWVPSEDISQLYLLSCLTLIPMIITGSINTIFNVYTVTSKLKVPALVLLATGIANTALVMILLSVTDLGVIAIPLVSAIVSILRNLLFTPIYAAHCLKQKWYTFYKDIARGSLCTAVMMLITWLLTFFIIPNTWFKLIASAVIASTISLIINSFFVFNRNDRISFIKSIKKIKSNINKE